MNKNELIIVTGGAGFIGSNLVSALNKGGYKNIIIVDHLTDSGKWENLRELSYSEYYDREDFLKNIESFKKEKIKAIFHLGACSATTEKDENYLLYNNTKYSKALFDFCIHEDCQFIYASSAATYGDGASGYKDTEENLKPLNCYGYSKHLFDGWVKNSDKKPKQWVGLKFFNVYGPYEYHKGRMSSMVLHGYRQIFNEGLMTLFKSHKKEYVDGGQKRDFVYVKDVVKVMVFFLNNPDKSGIYNVGTGMSQSFNELAEAIFHALEKPASIRYIDMPEDIRNTYQYFTEADISNLREAGYKESFQSLKEGVSDYVKGYLVKNKQ